MIKNKLKAMLVDDNEIDLFLHDKLLEINNLASSCIKFTSGHDAIIHLLDTTDFPDYILLDIQMPEMDGFGFLEQYELLLSQKKLKSIIVMVSSSLNFDDISKANANPLVSGFLHKPLKIKDLNTILTKEGILVQQEAHLDEGTTV
jgi:CheY-like chemotaxis protein